MLSEADQEQDSCGGIENLDAVLSDCEGLASEKKTISKK